MRLLSNLLVFAQRDGSPLPRFWYFPDRHKAVLVMAGDDHGTRDGTRDHFERMIQASPEGCDVSRWECYRATAWMYTGRPLSQDDAARYAALGFDIGVHVNTGCLDWSQASLKGTFARDLRRSGTAIPSCARSRETASIASHGLRVPSRPRSSAAGASAST